MTVEFTKDMWEARYLHDLDKFRELLDRDYVTRWGTVSIQVPREVQGETEHRGYVRDMIKRRAEYMGATVVDIDDPLISGPFEHKFTDTVTYTWKVRRD